MRGREADALRAQARELADLTVGRPVYPRGLIELSNICRKDCLYCGLRVGNTSVERYMLTDSEVLQAAEQARKQGFGSVVIQSGEIQSEGYSSRIENLVKEIKRSGMAVTLSLGEQSADTYRRWKQAGADRYLLRIETSDRDLYKRIHPDTPAHSYEKRLQALQELRAAGFQVGTGVMIGLPGQSVESLAADLLFMRAIDVDMCGMGPYIECAETPLADAPESFPVSERIELTLNMIATLRLMMPDINIAATTALDTLRPGARDRAIGCGANVIMPNVTPDVYRDKYALYKRNSPLETALCGYELACGQPGDPLHWIRRKG